MLASVTEGEDRVSSGVLELGCDVGESGFVILVLVPLEKRDADDGPSELTEEAFFELGIAIEAATVVWVLEVREIVLRTVNLDSDALVGSRHVDDEAAVDCVLPVVADAKLVYDGGDVVLEGRGRQGR